MEPGALRALCRKLAPARQRLVMPNIVGRAPQRQNDSAAGLLFAQAQLLETSTAPYDEKDAAEHCNSACAIVAMGGVRRTLGNIGLHRPTVPRSEAATFKQAQATYVRLISELEKFFSEMALPRLLLDRMMNIGPEGIDQLYYPRVDIRQIVPDFYAPFQEWLHPRCASAEKYYSCMSNERHREIRRRAGLPSDKP